MGSLLLAQKKELHRSSQSDFKLRHIPRLGDVAIDSALVHSGDRRIQLGIRGRENPYDIFVHLGHLSQKLNPSLTWHFLIGHDDPDFIFALLKDFEALRAIACEENFEFLSKQAVKGFAGLFFVVYEENSSSWNCYRSCCCAGR